jgi:hypothetical protein
MTADVAGSLVLWGDLEILIFVWGEYKAQLALEGER